MADFRFAGWVPQFAPLAWDAWVLAFSGPRHVAVTGRRDWSLACSTYVGPGGIRLRAIEEEADRRGEVQAQAAAA